MFGENEILLNDCLLSLPDYPANLVDLVIADLPFGQTNCVWDKTINLKSFWQALNHVCKERAAMIFFATQKFAVELINSNPKNFRYDLIWRKNNLCGHLNAAKMPLRNHETILLFYRALPIYNPQKWQSTVKKLLRSPSPSLVYGKQKNESVMWKSADGLRLPLSVLQFNAESERFNTKTKGTQHSTQKPVDLFEYLIKTYSNENDLILDPTSGSGTTAIAAINTNRRFICIEKDLLIWKMSSERLTKHIQKQNESLFSHEAI